MATASAPARPLTLRRNLTLIVLVALLPMGLFAAVLFYLLWDNQQTQRYAEQLARARVVAALVDSELNSSIERLQLLGSEPLLDEATMPQFYQRVVALLPGNEDWANVLLISREAQVFNARLPYGSPLPRLGDQPYQREAFETMKPAVSDLFIARTRGNETVDIAVPVLREGRAKYLLLVSLRRQHLGEVLRRQIGDAGIASLLDRNLRIIARSSNEQAFYGQSAAPDFAAKLRSAADGYTRSTTKEGLSVFSAWTRTRSGWIVVTSHPSEAADSALAQYLALLTLVWLAVLLTGLVMARLLYRRIDKSLTTTVTVANQLAAGQAATFPPTSFGELNTLAGAFEILFTQERRARAEAEAANRAKDEFLAMLGHELRNPIGAIANAGHILSMDGRSQSGDAMARRVIQRQTEILRRLIDDLLDMGRVLTGKIALDSKPIDLAQCVRHAVESLNAGGRAARHRLEMHVAETWIIGDPTRIDQILTNLLINAVNYTPPGGRITVTAARDGAQVVLSVADSGVGIAPASLPQVFDLFFQEAQQIDRPKSGLGIGLTLVQRLVELHGGTAVAASPGTGKGATFTLRFPATLELDGHEVRGATDGLDALEQLRGFHPDAMIIDIGMPGMDGYALAREIRSRLAAGQLGPPGYLPTLIALTGYGLPEDQRRAVEAGFDHHMVKPADFERLAALLAEVKKVPAA